MKIIKYVINFNRNFSGNFIKFCSKLFGSIDRSEDAFYGLLRGRSYDCVIEIGGANRPLFNKKLIKNYVGVDIDQSFLWHEIYSEYYAQSFEELIPKSVKGDLIVSKYVLEHVADNRKVFRNIKLMLASGGISLHIFPLGFHPFSLVNRMVGNRIAKFLIPILRPGTETVTGYPAYYHLCNSVALERLLNELKLKYEIKYFFGAEDYFSFFAPLGCAIHLFNRIAYLFGWNIFASNAVLLIYG